MEICYQDLGECISCFEFSPMGYYFAAGLIDETVCVWKYKEFME
jgi:WD40 repeat protein